jgi:hypothetical protein
MLTGHTHGHIGLYIDSRTDKLYYYTHLVLMNCTSVYTTYINGTHTQTH